MMRVYLDGNLLNDAGDTLAAALDAVRARVGERLVIDLLADGLPVPAAHLDDPPSTSPYARELRATTADPRLLVREALHEAADLLRAAAAAHQSAAEMVQSGALEKALGSLTQALDAWESANRTATMCLQIPSIAGVASRVGLDGAVKDLSHRLTEVKSALARQDWSTLADVLAYDMPGLIDRWTTMLTTLARELTP